MTDKAGCTHAELVPRVVALEAAHEADIRFSEERDRRYSDRADAQDKAVATALASSKEAVQKAELSTERRLEGLNELRKMATDQAGTYARDDKVNLRFDAMVKQLETLDVSLGHRITTLEQTVATNAGRVNGMNLIWSIIVAGGGLVIGIAGVIIALVTSGRLH